MIPCNGRNYYTFTRQGHLDGDLITSTGQEVIGGSDYLYHTHYTSTFHFLGELIKYDDYYRSICHAYFNF